MHFVYVHLGFHGSIPSFSRHGDGQVGADLHDVVGLVSPGLRPRIERPGHVAARSLKYHWRAGWVAIRKRSAATPSSARAAITAGAQPFVGYGREVSERWRSVMLVAGG